MNKSNPWIDALQTMVPVNFNKQSPVALAEISKPTPLKRLKTSEAVAADDVCNGHHDN